MTPAEHSPFTDHKSRPAQRRVVITGIGPITCIGTGREAFWQSIRAARSGITRITSFDTSELKAHCGGEIRDWNPLRFFAPHRLKRLDRYAQFAVASTLLVAARRPDAIMCANDEIAMGVLEAARAARITIPHDLAVTGWDDIPAASHLAPPLTTVRQPMLDLGRRAAELLRDRISTHRSEPLHELLATEMVIRSSCGCTSAT